MVKHCQEPYKNIAIAAARSDAEAYEPFLRMMSDAHTKLQPAKDEVARVRTGSRNPQTHVQGSSPAFPQEYLMPPIRVFPDCPPRPVRVTSVPEETRT